jgi:hypothetical protein
MDLFPKPRVPMEIPGLVFRQAASVLVVHPGRELKARSHLRISLLGSVPGIVRQTAYARGTLGPPAAGAGN